MGKFRTFQVSPVKVGVFESRSRQVDLPELHICRLRVGKVRSLSFRPFEVSTRKMCFLEARFGDPRPSQISFDECRPRQIRPLELRFPQMRFPHVLMAQV